MAKPIQLLSKSNNGFEMNVLELGKIFEILDKIGDRSVAILSINGTKRTGKSFLLNYFLRYLKYGQKYGNYWIEGVNEDQLKGFHWGLDDHKRTFGIWMWSKPYLVKDNFGNDIVLLLLDTQGIFNKKNSFHECAVVYTLSLLLSSIFIFNTRSDSIDKKLEFIEYFTHYAQSFSGQTGEDLFQRFILLIRDFRNEKNQNYQFGYYDRFSTESFNYMEDLVMPNIDIEHIVKPNTDNGFEQNDKRIQILDYFSRVSCYLMPHPGDNVSANYFIGQNDYMSSSFLMHVSIFVKQTLLQSELEPKTIGGITMTGISLKNYLIKFSQLIKTHKFPQLSKAIKMSCNDVRYMLAVKYCLRFYAERIHRFIYFNPSDRIFFYYHLKQEEQCIRYLDTFQLLLKGIIDSKHWMNQALRTRILYIYNSFRTINLVRIDRLKVKTSIIRQSLFSKKEEKQGIQTLLIRKEIENLSKEQKINFKNNFKKLEQASDILKRMSMKGNQLPYVSDDIRMETIIEDNCKPIPLEFPRNHCVIS